MVQKISYQRLTPYLRGAVYAFFLAGYTLTQIQDEVRKPDGSTPSVQSISNTVSQCKKEGGFGWDGSASMATSTGRPRASTPALDKKIKDFVFKHRGRAKVTVKFVKKHLKAARSLTSRTLHKRIEEAGFAWRRRRHKSIIPSEHKPARMSFAKWVLKQTAATVKQWAFTDGVSFYLSRTAAEQEHRVRAALGPYVYRMADGSDSLYEECIGPSSYRKCQGSCVRIWGMLLLGTLFIYVLPEDHERGKCMNRFWYEWLLLKQFPKWIAKAMGSRRKPTHLIQDHEKALWAKEPRSAMRQIGLKLLERYPKCSQDLNPIETVWRELRSRLDATEPMGIESRDAFVVRVRNAVKWINRNRRALFLELCSDQKERAREVLSRRGSRTSF